MTGKHDGIRYYHVKQSKGTLRPFSWVNYVSFFYKHIKIYDCTMLTLFVFTLQDIEMHQFTQQDKRCTGLQDMSGSDDPSNFVSSRGIEWMFVLL